jgi:hypothetical protein
MQNSKPFGKKPLVVRDNSLLGDGTGEFAGWSQERGESCIFIHTKTTY